ncbi:putative regulatory protein [Escherichia coli]|uniref:Putative regulatory protein n=1 Tax=Escherichia coli TaxID=562 RepID=A0A376UII9_ECOLX|nr:putative regulatory protein [Escherichia coli]
MGIIRHWLPASGEKMRKAPILFHYTNLAEGVTEQRLGNGCLCAVGVMGNLYRSVSQITPR